MCRLTILVIIVAAFCFSHSTLTAEEYDWFYTDIDSSSPKPGGGLPHYEFRLWESIGPAGAGIISIAVSPNYSSDGTILAGDISNGVYKSTDRGITWTQVNSAFQNCLWGIYYNPLPDLTHIEALAISPDFASDQTVFAGTAYTGEGMFRSIDGGQHWLQINDGLADMDIHSVTCSPDYKDDRTVFTGLLHKPSGLYLSTDGGSFWTSSVPSIGYAMPFTFSANYDTDQTMFVGTGGNGIYKSEDCGYNWVEFGLDGISFQSLVYCEAYTTDFLLAGSISEGIFIRRLSFLSFWVPANSGIEDLISGSIVESLAVSPLYASDKRIFAAISTSTDSYVFQGKVSYLKLTKYIIPRIDNWEQIGPTIKGYQVDTMAVTEDGGAVRIFVGTLSGSLGNGVLTILAE